MTVDETHIESIKRGDWIVVTRWKHWRESYTVDYQVVYNEHPTYAGTPGEVLAVALPFIVFKDLSGETRTLDVRAFAVRKVPLNYVREFLKEGGIETTKGHLYKETKTKATKKRLEELKGACPNCGEKLSMKKKTTDKKWGWVCRPCGFEGYVR